MSFREKLKNLTPEQCIHIARLEQPEIHWKYVKSKYEWQGHDLIPQSIEEGDPSPVFQIDYRENPNELFRMYDRFGKTVPIIDLFKIIDYINSI